MTDMALISYLTAHDFRKRVESAYPSIILIL